MLSARDEATLQRLTANWKLTPATFAHRISKGLWIPSPWLQYAATRVAHGIIKGGARIIISAPPRHGKTQLIAKYTSAWVLETLPQRNVMLTGYGSDLTEQSAREVRQMIWENEDILKCRIPRETSRIEAFLTNQGGYMYSVGLGGAITGRGAHVLLIDDYIKEIKEALSPTTRDYIWNWFVTTAMTRLEPGASVIIIATRWHSDDLIGRILKNFPGQWENICFPAEAEEHDIIGRVPGQALFPERYDIDYLRSQHELMGTIFYNALFQQRPTDESLQLSSGAWLKLLRVMPDIHDLRWARIWDCAATEDGGDYSCGSLVGHSKSMNLTIVANIVRGQWSPQTLESKIRQTALADGTDVTVLVEQEPGASGKNLVNHIATVVLPEFNVKPTASTTKKLIRAQPLLAAAEAGHVYLLANTENNSEDAQAPWIQPFVHEFDHFPAGLNDDQVDTVAAGYAYLSGRKHFSATWGRSSRSDNGDSKRNSRKIRQASFMMGSRGAVSRVTFGRR